MTLIIPQPEPMRRTGRRAIDKNAVFECLIVLILILAYSALLGWFDARDQRLEKNRLAVENRKLKQTTQSCTAELNNGLNRDEVHAYEATCYMHGRNPIARKS